MRLNHMGLGLHRTAGGGRTALLLGVLLLWGSLARAVEDSAAKGVEFFENKIRPVLVERCYKCHSAQAKHKGGLVLDLRENLLKGGDSGPAAVPGHADASLIIRAVRGEDKELKMPPADQEGLTTAQVQDLVAWVNMGVPYPRVSDAPNASVAKSEDMTEARRFWSYQPLQETAMPKVKQTDWPRGAIDAFVLAKLEENNLSPAPPADKRTLLRRATYDLIGLPPTPEEVEAFVADASPNAFSRVIDRLLASPRYGEHWGRHWLDVARYGDTRWVGAGEDKRLPFAYTYRDWVIGALNRDVPYDRFVTLQLAADQVPDRKEQGDLAALGFLSGGKWFTGNVHEILDDQIDVVTRGLLGLTVQCARCHDHKYDPIPTKDYYSLYGLFAASRMPVDGTGMLADLPAVVAPPVAVATEAEITAERNRIDTMLADRQAAIRDECRPAAKIAEYLLAAQLMVDQPDKVIKDFAKLRSLSDGIFNRWVRLVKRTVKEPQPIFGPWHAFAAIPEREFAAKAAGVAEVEKTKALNKHVQKILSPPPASQAELAHRYAELFLSFDKADTESDRDDEAIRQILRGNDSPILVPLGELTPYFSKAELEQITEMRRAVLGRLAKLPAAADQYLAFRREFVPLRDEVAAFIAKRCDAVIADVRSPEKIADYLLAANDGKAADELRLKSIAKRHKVSERMLARWIGVLKRAADQNDAVFAAWRVLAAIPENEFAAKAGLVIAELKKGGNRHVAATFATPPATLAEAAARYAKLIVQYDKDAPAADADEEAIRQVTAGAHSVTHVARDEAADFFTQKDNDELKGKEGRLLRLFNDHPGTTASAMALRETSRGYGQRVFVRGNPNVLGPETPGAFLAILSPKNSEPFHAGRGRLELAKAIVDPANPLTARVIVNRVWAQHFGTGLVATTSDFGVRGDRPSHPELLDALARQFMADGWSLKALHRRIMLSATYQQASQDNPAARQVDPENRLLWRANRRRLSFEEVRDSLLVATRRLDFTMGGRADDLVKAGARRRTVYGVVDRISLPGFYRYFDFPSADAHVPARHETIIPQQALFMMNNTFVMDQAQRLALRAKGSGEMSPQALVAALYRQVYARPPSTDELALGVEFLSSAPPPEQAPQAGPWQYGYGAYGDSENRVVEFEPFPYFVNGTWRGGPQEIDPLIGRCSLNARGGLATVDPTRSLIRRWVAPQDGVVGITATLNVQSPSLQPNGEGARARIVSSRGGQLGVWIAHGTEEQTNLINVEVKRGDTIDFVVEGRGQQDGITGFTWAPVLKMDGPDSPKNPKLLWDCGKDFTGKMPERRPLGVAERYAQVLLESNEFMFLD